MSRPQTGLGGREVGGWGAWGPGGLGGGVGCFAAAAVGLGAEEMRPPRVSIMVSTSRSMDRRSIGYLHKYARGHL